MFKRFVVAEEISSVTNIKSSSVRGIKRGICDQYPSIEEHIDDIIPKKEEVKEARGKCVFSCRNARAQNAGGRRARVCS